MRPYERLLKYIAIRTPSDEESQTVPSSTCQFELAHHLYRELFTMGIKDIKIDTQCYLYAHIPPTPGYEDCPKIGFIAHLDTVSDFCDHRIIAEIHEDYNGRDLALGTSGRILSPDMFPHLKELKGRTLITSDGTTILGADDKAGIAEIVTMVERILDENIPHGPVSIAFTPDEEIGMGAAHFNVEEFGADFAYTLDGDTEGEIQYENFNAAKAEFQINGVNVHPGSSKDIMVNAALAAMEINSMLPQDETPRNTDGYEGFYHLTDMKGDVGHAVLRYIIRDHDAEKFEERKTILRAIEKKINQKWGRGTASLTITDQYRNMAEIISGCMHLIENAKKACENAGVTPLILPIRGGTDGAQLSFKGLPCPNLGTGGHGYHGPYEHITVEGMDAACETALELVKIYAQKAD
ncbi:MAG TPA: peptidase T [Candidatus Mediterraneibacter stercorigallinarum]|uniref:Peptidase T n=1 Tax=Candidatus Mediterraneibacter stercorigallinarum TaxID=2838686 RepID=A0A9D2IJT5_9FIRM|nr:peptidase T [Candidatus Mediterraneibacter stercorigallinarum]